MKLTIVTFACGAGHARSFEMPAGTISADAAEYANRFALNQTCNEKVPDPGPAGKRRCGLPVVRTEKEEWRR